MSNLPISDTSDPVVYLGVDVAKATLDAYCSKQNFSLIANTQEAHIELLTTVSKLFPDTKLHLVCEATGGYEQPLVRSALEAGWNVSVVPPSRVRQFAKACGIMAKTDAIDARLIHRYAQTVPGSTRASISTKA